MRVPDETVRSAVVPQILPGQESKALLGQLLKLLTPLAEQDPSPRVRVQAYSALSALICATQSKSASYGAILLRPAIVSGVLSWEDDMLDPQVETNFATVARPGYAMAYLTARVGARALQERTSAAATLLGASLLQDATLAATLATTQEVQEGRRGMTL